mmetsp:Transcript_6583/g.27667  ORF Transcript_6583/g.27667 Transcript_6583/m.27667 type:complete len:308 (-) Transcript_6583:490-1413(-)
MVLQLLVGLEGLLADVARVHDDTIVVVVGRGLLLAFAAARGVHVLVGVVLAGHLRRTLVVVRAWWHSRRLGVVVALPVVVVGEGVLLVVVLPRRGVLLALLRGARGGLALSAAARTEIARRRSVVVVDVAEQRAGAHLVRVEGVVRGLLAPPAFRLEVRRALRLLVARGFGGFRCLGVANFGGVLLDARVSRAAPRRELADRGLKLGFGAFAARLVIGVGHAPHVPRRVRVDLPLVVRREAPDRLEVEEAVVEELDGVPRGVGAAERDALVRGVLAQLGVLDLGEGRAEHGVERPRARRVEAVVGRR